MWFLSSTVAILACTVFVIEIDFTAGKSTELYVRHGSLHRQLQHLTEKNSWGSGRSNRSGIVNHKDRATHLTIAKRSPRNPINDFRIPGKDLMNKVYCSYKVKLKTYNDHNNLRIYNIECDGNIGSSCPNNNYCMQSFEKVHVPTRYNGSDELTIFTGCVCATKDIPRSKKPPNVNL